MADRTPQKVLTSRKTPRQERSRQTVKVILDATAQVLVKRGYEGTTTGAVVGRAGVSIGTLYQYFPNKESLVAALIGAHVTDVLALVETALRETSNAPIEVMLRAVIRASLDAHRLQPDLHKVFAEQVPHEGLLGEAMKVNEQIAQLLQSDLLRRIEGMTQQRTRMIAFVLETVIEALTHRAIIEGPHWLSTGLLEKEALALLITYVADATSLPCPVGSNRKKRGGAMI